MPQTRGLRRMAGPGRKRRGAAGKARYAYGGPASRQSRRTRNIEFENFQKGGRAINRMARPGGKLGFRNQRGRTTMQKGGRMMSRMARPGGKAGLRGRGYQTFARGGSVQKASFANESLMTNNRSLVEMKPDRTDMIGSGWRGKRR